MSLHFIFCSNQPTPLSISFVHPIKQNSIGTWVNHPLTLLLQKKTAKSNFMKDLPTDEKPLQDTILNPLKSLYHEKGSFFSYKPIYMKTETNTDATIENNQAVRIKPLIDSLINSVLSTCVARHNLIINDVPQELQMTIGEDKLALVVGNLMSNVINFVQDDCLHIDASNSGEIILRLNNTNLSRNKSFVVSLETILFIAERFGISLKIEEFYGKGTDVSVCFLKKAA